MTDLLTLEEAAETIDDLRNSLVGWIEEAESHEAAVLAEYLAGSLVRNGWVTKGPEA